MVRQLQTISDYKVHFVTESEVVANMDSAVHHTLAKINPAVSDLASDIWIKNLISQDPRLIDPPFPFKSYNMEIYSATVYVCVPSEYYISIPL